METLLTIALFALLAGITMGLTVRLLGNEPEAWALACAVGLFFPITLPVIIAFYIAIGVSKLGK